MICRIQRLLIGGIEMNWVDIVIIAAILGVALLGFKIGLLRAAFLLGAFILGITISSEVAASLNTLLEEFIENSDVRDLITFTGAFVLIFVGVNFVGGIICKMLRFTPFKWLDQLIGGALGLLAGVVFVGLIVVWLTKSPISGLEELFEKSALAPIMKELVSPIFQEFLEKKSSVAFVVFGRRV